MEIRIVLDTDIASPREWDNLGTMVCWHRRYNLGDEMPQGDPHDWYRENVPVGSEVLPLFMYDHSGITMRTYPFGCRWDSGQVGWIFCTPERIRKEYGRKHISKKLRRKVQEILQAEVKVYDQFLRGACWGYEIKEGDDTVDSCYGFLGDELGETGILWHLDKYPQKLIEEAWEARR